jgi:glyoxylase-like metal-dependent hydrolase (beta-lactamase superfamily II)
MDLERDVAPGIHRIEDAFTNWYLVEGEGDEVTIVDAGVRSSWNSLGAALTQIGKTADDVAAVVLTHAHFDHIGFAERARKELGVEVWVHEDDVPLTKHPLQYSHERSRLGYLARPQAMPIVLALLRGGAFWPTPVASVRRYADAGVLPLPGGARIVPTPGHTLGHCSFHLPERDALIAGDAIVTLDPYTGTTGPRIVAGAATADFDRALASLDGLAETEASIVLTGHGPAWRDGGVASAVAAAREAGLR